MQDIDTIIDSLQLHPHPEGGFYKEMYRSKTIVHDSSTERDKSACTSIYFLLSGQDFSCWHRIKSDETWFHHLGCDVLIYFFNESQNLKTVQLGPKAQNFQGTIPANAWFAAKPLNEDSFCLVSCVVAPGFEFDEFEIAKRDVLLDEYGNSQENIQAIEAFTRNQYVK
jgi:predicted cupin superfamily sugar epimerase